MKKHLALIQLLSAISALTACGGDCREMARSISRLNVPKSAKTVLCEWGGLATATMGSFQLSEVEFAALLTEARSEGYEQLIDTKSNLVWMRPYVGREGLYLRRSRSNSSIMAAVLDKTTLQLHVYDTNR